MLQGQSIILSNFLHLIRSELSEWLVNLLINIQPLGVERCKGLKLSLLLIFSLLYSRRKHMPTVTYLRLDGSTPVGSRHPLVQSENSFIFRFRLLAMVQYLAKQREETMVWYPNNITRQRTTYNLYTQVPYSVHASL